MVVHWDDVAAVRIEEGDLRGTRWRLGAAAGAKRVGLSRYPRSGKLSVRGVRAKFLVQRVDYWEGEPS
jgi:hypothetical protein